MELGTAVKSLFETPYPTLVCLLWVLVALPLTELLVYAYPGRQEMVAQGVRSLPLMCPRLSTRLKAFCLVQSCLMQAFIKILSLSLCVYVCMILPFKWINISLKNQMNWGNYLMGKQWLVGHIFKLKVNFDFYIDNNVTY